MHLEPALANQRRKIEARRAHPVETALHPGKDVTGVIRDRGARVAAFFKGLGKIGPCSPELGSGWEHMADAVLRRIAA